jgi:peptidoglycan/LPS O-acetylase OafA/YrhL
MLILNNGELLGLVDILCYITITLLFSLVTYKYVEVPSRKQICDKTLGKPQAKENN